MPKAGILVIEDDEHIQELLKYNLGQEGYRISSAVTGEEGLKLVKSRVPDLIILDLMLPGMDGLEICRILKRDDRTRYVPVIMLTAKGEESDIIAGLELGAEDYITKPFSPRVLIARLRMVLRRRDQSREADEAGLLAIHELSINQVRHEVMVKGKPLKLTLTEFRLLHFLAKNRGRVFTRYQMVDAVRGDDYSVTERSVDVQIVGLRRKLGAAGKYIETVRGVGYRFQE